MNEESTPPGAEDAAPGDQQAGQSGPPPAGQMERALEEARASARTFRDQLLRKAAEFENYKRRTEAEYIATVRNANEALITALLPIVEDLVRSLKAGAAAGDGEGLTRGVELIYQKLMKVLEAQGLTPFDSLGKPFDVEEHDALLQVVRDDVAPGTVVEEIAPGYRFHDRVLRHAKVIVSAPSRPAPEPDGAHGPGESKESAES